MSSLTPPQFPALFSLTPAMPHPAYSFVVALASRASNLLLIPFISVSAKHSSPTGPHTFSFQSSLPALPFIFPTLPSLSAPGKLLLYCFCCSPILPPEFLPSPWVQLFLSSLEHLDTLVWNPSHPLLRVTRSFCTLYVGGQNATDLEKKIGCVILASVINQLQKQGGKGRDPWWSPQVPLDRAMRGYLEHKPCEMKVMLTASTLLKYGILYTGFLLQSYAVTTGTYFCTPSRNSAPHCSLSPLLLSPALATSNTWYASVWYPILYSSYKWNHNKRIKCCLFFFFFYFKEVVICMGNLLGGGEPVMLSSILR